jgi:hypothetical protein
MHGPAQIFHRLISPQAVAGPEPIVLDFQSPQHPPPTLGQRVALDALVPQVGGHPFEVLFQALGDFAKRLRRLPIQGPLLQGRECLARLWFILVHFVEEGGGRPEIHETP